MTIRHFDDGYWRDETREDWKRRALHWHCHSSHMSGRSYGDEPARRDPATDLAPKVIREWLDKPSRTIRLVARTPEEAIAWLGAQWKAVVEQVGQEAAVIPEETRFGRALHDLRCGGDVCWGFWLGSSTHLHLAVVATDQACH